MFISTKYGLFISSGDYETFFDNCMFTLRIETQNNSSIENKSYKFRDKRRFILKKKKVLSEKTNSLF
jgi:hypothetical protein